MNKPIYVSRKELVECRVSILRDMDNYIRENVEDENDFDNWLAYGVPDEASDDILRDIASDDKCWISVIECFAECVLYSNGEVKW